MKSVIPGTVPTVPAGETDGSPSVLNHSPRHQPDLAISPCLTSSVQPGMTKTQKDAALGERLSMARPPRPRPGGRVSATPEPGIPRAAASPAAVAVNLLNWPHGEVRRLEERQH